MRFLRFFPVAFLVVGACDGVVDPPRTDGGRDGGTGIDGGSSDGGGTTDAGTDAGADTGTDAGVLECRPPQHACGDRCFDLLPNSPSNGCALGCGDPCPGGTDAICNPDGTCGIGACEPTTCESLGVVCGVIDNGCGGRRSCGSCDASRGETCEGGTCVVICPPDPNEPNDTSATAVPGASLTDSPATSATITNGTLHQADDQDWYRFAVADTGFGGNPIITVALSGVPIGANYDVAAYYQCTSGAHESTCTMGARDDRIGTGCSSAGRATDTVVIDTECGGTITDSGVLFIRVSAVTWTGSCSQYTVQVGVD